MLLFGLRWLVVQPKLVRHPDKSAYRRLTMAARCRFPHSDNPGGLNGSMQHLLKVLLQEPRKLVSFAGVNSNKTKALLRF
jgi:hypothetical protein